MVEGVKVDVDVDVGVAVIVGDNEAVTKSTSKFMNALSGLEMGWLKALG